MNLLMEIGIIFAVCLLGEAVAALLPVAFPSSVISMMLLLAFLLCGVIKEKWIGNVSRFFVANMGIFFVPALVRTMEHAQMLKSVLIPFAVVTLVTTPVVYFVTAWTVQLMIRMMGRKGEKKDA